MRRSLAVVCTGLLLASGSVFAFDYSPTQTAPKVVRAKPAPVSQKLLDSMVADETLVKGADMVVTSFDGSRVELMQGNLSDPLAGDLAKAAKDYIVSHKDIFNVPTTRGENVMKMIKNEDAAGAQHVFYQMMLDGVPVQNSVIDVHIGKDKRVQLANGSFPTVKEVTNQVSINRLDAIASAKRALNAKKIRGTPKAELVVVAENDKGRMAFNVKMATENGDWDMMIDAESGKEISRLNQMVFADPADTHEGTGSVYKNHPLLGDATVEPLLHLTSHGLEGKYAKAVNEDTTGSVSEKDEHIYDPNDTHFDEVMIYYHINRIHDFHKSIGNDKMDRQMKATVHVQTNYDNAYYSPMEDAMAFGDGSRFNDLAKEETVCYHEYSHAALNPIVSLNYSKESGAMNEGQADYFACSFTNDDKLGEYVCAKMGKPYLRIMTNNLHYPEDIQNEVHADGKIWGGILWDIRNALGAEVADRLIHKSFYYLKPGSPTFAQGAAAIITADKNLNEGKNKEALLGVFKKRGITVAALEGQIIDSQDLKKVQTFRSLHGK